MGIDACDAGKDVYVEKPIAHHIRDGRLLVDAARRNNRIVQVGTQQRSGAHFQRAVKYVQEGRIGDVCYASCWNHSPRTLNPPAPTKGGPPPGMDWDMWLGPAPKLPYDEVWNTGRRGSWEFWGGMITEWGSHLTDIVLWAMNAKAARERRRRRRPVRPHVGRDPRHAAGHLQLPQVPVPLLGAEPQHLRPER